MTRAWRATSLSQPRARASSRKLISSASWACSWQLGNEFGCGGVVVALLADVGVGARLGGETS